MRQGPGVPGLAPPEAIPVIPTYQDALLANINNSLIGVIQQINNSLTSRLQALEEHQRVIRGQEQHTLLERVNERLTAFEALVCTECEKISSLQAQQGQAIFNALQGFRVLYKETRAKEGGTLADMSKQMTTLTQDLGETLEKLKDPLANCAWC